MNLSYAQRLLKCIWSHEVKYNLKNNRLINIEKNKKSQITGYITDHKFSLIVILLFTNNWKLLSKVKDIKANILLKKDK